MAPPAFNHVVSTKPERQGVASVLTNAKETAKLLKFKKSIDNIETRATIKTQHQRSHDY
jgi:hypothetical protein